MSKSDRNALFHVDPVETPVDYYFAKLNLKRLLRMKKLPNKVFPWLNRQRLEEIDKRSEWLYKKVSKYMGR